MKKYYFSLMGWVLAAIVQPAHAQQLKLWYGRPATEWVAALPIGNGRLGAMVFGGVTDDRIQFNEETLWSGGPRDYNRKGAYKYLDSIRGLLFAGKQKEAESLAGREFLGLKSPEGEYQARYQPFGDIHFYFDVDTASVTQYRRTLNLEDATLTTSYKSGGTTFKRTYIASAPDQVIAVNLQADKAGAIHFETALSSPHQNFILKKIDANTVALHVQVKDGALFGESYVRVTARNGSIAIKDNRIVVTGADEATVWVTAATNYRNYKDVSGQPAALCKAALQKIGTKSFARVLNDHIKEYQSYFNMLSVHFGNPSIQGANTELPTDQRLAQFARTGDPEFVALYLQYGRYLLISSSRPGTYPANLQGIWNDLLSPPWGSKYTTNINAEMNYWPAELLGLSPLHSAFFKMTQEVAASGRETAKEYYNAPGWVLHHNTDLWRGTAPINASDHGIWVTGGAWFCEHLWERYLFTKDERFLRDTAYPIMRDAALFFNSFLVKDPVSGYLISTPSNSPEQGGLVAGPAMDHQIIRALFRNTIEASKILNRDGAFRKELEDKYRRIAPNKIGRYGQLQEWMQDVDDTTNKHRHVSHLWGVYPGNEINWETTPDLMKAARQSLIYRGDAATGWSLGWKINLWARFKDGNHTYKLIQMLLSPAGRGAGSYPNLFDAHPPFQIDGNFGGAAGIGEMLVQSHTAFIDILPALPDALPGGRINGIHARGGLVLDLEWDNKQLTALTIKAIADGHVTLRYNGIALPVAFKKGKRYKVAPGFNSVEAL